MEKGFLDSRGRGSNHKKKKGFSGANVIGSTDSNFATGLSTTANDSTVSISLDDINRKKTNDMADLDKHFSVDSSTAKNVGVEARNSKESLGNT
nr:hypothetical protein [Tanacetum cinerariifolium]